MPYDDRYLHMLRLWNLFLTVTSSGTNTLGQGLVDRQWPGDPGLAE